MPIEPGTGAYPAAFRARELADRETLVSLIVLAIADEFSDDDAVRWALAKQWDFAVTDAAREFVIRKKAEQVFNALLDGMKAALVLGDAVSINGFGTLHVEGPSQFWPVKVRDKSATVEPVFDHDEIIIEHRTAEIGGAWVGGAVVQSMGHEEWESKNIYHLDGAWGGAGSGQEVIVFGSWWGVGNGPSVVGVGDDGVTRSINVGGLNIVIALRVDIDFSGGGDGRYTYNLIPGQAAAVDRILAAANPLALRDGYLGAARSVYAACQNRLVAGGNGSVLGGVYRPMTIDEWAMVSGRVPSQEQITNGYFDGIPAAAVLPSYPRWVPIVRILGEIWEVRKIPKYDYKQIFANRETELREAGVWPERTRGDYLTVRFSGRQEFIDALNNPIISNQ